MATLEPVDFTAPDAPERFAWSLRETGFGVLTNHPLDPAQVSSIYANWQGFFDGQDKHDFVYTVGPQDGFFPAEMAESAKGRSVKDIKEYFHFYPWGKCPPTLRDELLDYYSKAGALAQTLLGWVEDNTPASVSGRFSQPLSAMMDGSEQSLLRILHYPPLTGDEAPSAIRAAAHEDINLLTILPASNEPGLQVLAKDGSWIDVPCEFGNLIVNIGDMLQEATDAHYPSTTHRVINPEGARKDKSRISLPLFLHPRPDVRLSERYTADEYLKQRLRELGVI
ncbi:MAG: 2OG-Fe(II) oxygenase family protein [Pseudomonadota bacterium]